MDTLKVENHKNLVRDTRSRAILSTDLRKKQDADRIDKLEGDISEIKNMLINILNNSGVK